MSESQTLCEHRQFFGESLSFASDTQHFVCIRSCWSALHIWDYQIYWPLFQCRFNQDTWFSMWTLVLVSLDLKPLQIALHVESVTRVSASSRYSGHLELDDKPYVNIFLFYYCWIDIHVKQYQSMYACYFQYWDESLKVSILFNYFCRWKLGLPSLRQNWFPITTATSVKKCSTKYN